MIPLIRSLFASPEAERDPTAWATRYAAHVGVGAALWSATAWALGPWAVALVAALAVVWEAAQWQGGKPALWDGVLDATGMIFGALMFVPSVGLAAAVVLAAGVKARQ